jgi:hypothetical protein
MVIENESWAMLTFGFLFYNSKAVSLRVYSSLTLGLMYLKRFVIASWRNSQFSRLLGKQLTEQQSKPYTQVCNHTPEINAFHI